MECLPNDLLVLILSYALHPTDLYFRRTLRCVSRRFRNVLRSVPMSYAGVVLGDTNDFDAALQCACSAHRNELLVELDLSFCQVTNAVIESVSICSQLRRLKLCACTSIDAAVISLDPLAKLTFLEHMDFSCHVNDMGQQMAQLAWTTFHPSVRVLKSAGTSSHLIGIFNAPGAVNVEQLILPHFQHLVAWENVLSCEAIDLILSVVSRAAKLRELNLNGWFPQRDLYSNPQSIRNVAALIAALTKRKTVCEHELRLLELRRCAKFSDREIQSLRACSDMLDHDCDPLPPKQCLSSLVFGWMHKMKRSPGMFVKSNFGDSKKQKLINSSNIPTQTILADVREFFENVRSVSLMWCFADLRDRNFDTQSRGGHMNLSVRRGFALQLTDNHVAEGNGFSSFDADNAMHMYWETSSAEAYPQHKFMTLEEYLVRGVECDFSWYWPVSGENVWILKRRLKEKYLMKRSDE